MNNILKDEKFLPAALALIAGARKSIWISTFKAEITSKRRGLRLKEFFDLLAERASAGLDVRVLMNKRDNRGHVPESNAYALRFFKSSKIKVRYLPNDRVAHAKIILIDNEAAIFGSHNLSVRSCHNNFEVSCLSTSDEPVLLLVKAYQDTWDTGKDA